MPTYTRVVSEKSLDLNSELHPMPAKCRLHAYSFKEDSHLRIEEWGKSCFGGVYVYVCVCAANRTHCKWSDTQLYALGARRFSARLNLHLLQIDTLPETNSLHIKMNGWNRIVSFWGPAYLQVLSLLASGNVCKIAAKKSQHQLVLTLDWLFGQLRAIVFALEV